MSKPWSEHDKRMHEELSDLKTDLRTLVARTNILMLKIEQKYQIESELVSKYGQN